MDTTALAFYATICGVLAFAAPTLGAPFLRLLIGAGVGVAAAATLPLLRSATGY